MYVYVLHYIYKIHHTYDAWFKKNSTKNYIRFDMHVQERMKRNNFSSCDLIYIYICVSI